MDLASMISFGILVLAWMVLPIREAVGDTAGTPLEEMVSTHQVA